MSDSKQARDTPQAAHRANDALEFACDAARIAAANKSEDVVLLDLRGLSSLTDFFVIGTGSSDRQMHAVFDRVAEHARALGRRPFKVARTRDAKWFLADYVDVVIHLFDTQHRDYYDLDGLWGDAPRIAWGADGSAESARPAQ
jgi:ribosome-associated protein